MVKYMVMTMQTFSAQRSANIHVFVGSTLQSQAMQENTSLEGNKNETDLLKVTSLYIK